MEKIEKFDIRTLESKMRKGEITRKEYEDFLVSLKECDENDFVEIEEDMLLKNAGIKTNVDKKSKETGLNDE
ncbi:MAG TPA: hypothetical protein ENN58_00105 [bacterium]|nr:hypothetical protein [bacterium]